MWPEIGGELFGDLTFSTQDCQIIAGDISCTVVQLWLKICTTCLPVAQLRAHGYCISNQPVDLQYSDHIPSVMYHVIVQQAVFSRHRVYQSTWTPTA